MGLWMLTFFVHINIPACLAWILYYTNVYIFGGCPFPCLLWTLPHLHCFQYWRSHISVHNYIKYNKYYYLAFRTPNYKKPKNTT